MKTEPEVRKARKAATRLKKLSLPLVKKRARISPRILVYSFVALIAAGTVLLWLPVSTTSGQFSNEALRSKTAEFTARLKSGDSPERLLPEAFATVREASRRTTGQCHTSTQLMGGIVLHQGKIAEIKRGEGKELTTILPLYLNSLTGQG